MSILLRSLPVFNRTAKRVLAAAVPTVCAKQPSRDCFVVLIPEIPEDTPETNNLLQMNNVPNYDNVDAESAYLAVTKRLIDYEVTLNELDRNLSDPQYPRTFASILDPIEEVTATLYASWSALLHLNAIRDDEMMKAALEALSPKFEKVTATKYSYMNILRAIDDISVESALAPDQQQLIKRHQHMCRNGLGMLNPKKFQFVRFQGLEIAKNRQKYRDNVTKATNIFKVRLSPDTLKNFPENIKHYFATSSGPVVTLHEPQYSLFLKYCGDPMQRWNVYHAKTCRASTGAREEGNHLLTTYIRASRFQVAEAHGFKNFWEFSLQGRRAPPSKVVVDTIYNLSDDVSKIALEQLAELKQFCASKGFKAELERWDLPYWRRRYDEAHFTLDAAELREVFALPNVMTGLQSLVDKLFGVELREVQMDLWSEDAKAYKVFRNDRDIGTIIFDLQNRENKSFNSSCAILQRQTTAYPVKPSASVVMSLAQRTHFSIEELQQLLSHFGEALHQVLSEARYVEVAGIFDIPQHMAFVTPNLFKSLLLDKRIAKMILPQLTSDLHDLIVGKIQHLRAVDTLEEIYLSILDLELNTRMNVNARDIIRSVQPIVLKTYPYHSFEIAQTCSMVDLVAGHWACSYYTRVWSEMIAADVLEALTEKTEESALRKTSKHFCDTILVQSGMVAAEETFRQFRGRDPVVEPLLNVCRSRPAPASLIS